MRVLVVDDAHTAEGLVSILSPHLEGDLIAASPSGVECAADFAQRLEREGALDCDVVVVNANLRGDGAGGGYNGLEVLEHLLGKKSLRSVILSYDDDPVGASVPQRLKDESGVPLLKSQKVLHSKLPTNGHTLAQQITLASKGIVEDSTAPFLLAFHQRTSAEVSHKLKNLQAALRMLRGAARKRLVSRDEYVAILDTLISYHPDLSYDLIKVKESLSGLSWEVMPTPQPTKKVLLIDDQAETCAWRQILSPLCRGIGAELESEVSFERGENRLSNNPDAVLLDLHYANGGEDPGPFEVFTRAREANPLVPIVVFTVDREGRHVRDIAKDAFHYFFKEVHEEAGADTMQYAEAFQDVLRSAFNQSLPYLLRGFVRASLPKLRETQDPISKSRDLLELAASEVQTPEVSLFLTVGAVTEARIAFSHPTLGASWSHLENLFSKSSDHALYGLRGDLPKIVRMHRNYTSHYEEPNEPQPTVVDAVIFLLTATQFIADLRAIKDDEDISRMRDSELEQLLEVLGRIAQELSDSLTRRIILDADVLRTLRSLNKSSRGDLEGLIDSVLTKTNAVNPSAFTAPVSIASGVSGFGNLRAAWLGDGTGVMQQIEWDNGQHPAPYLLYLCRLLILERIAQM